MQIGDLSVGATTRFHSQGYAYYILWQIPLSWPTTICSHGPELFTKAARLPNRDKIPSERGRTGLQKKNIAWIGCSIYLNDSLAFVTEAGSLNMASIEECRNAVSLDKSSSRSVLWGRAISVNEKQRTWDITLKVFIITPPQLKLRRVSQPTGIKISHHTSWRGSFPSIWFLVEDMGLAHLVFGTVCIWAYLASGSEAETHKIWQSRDRR